MGDHRLDTWVSYSCSSAAAVAYDTSLVDLLSGRVFVLVNQILVDVLLDETVAFIGHPSVNKSI